MLQRALDNIWTKVKLRGTKKFVLTLQKMNIQYNKIFKKGFESGAKKYIGIIRRSLRKTSGKKSISAKKKKNGLETSSIEMRKLYVTLGED